MILFHEKCGILSQNLKNEEKIEITYIYKIS